MKIPAKRLLSMLMVFVMVLGIFPRVMAAETVEGVGSITEEPGTLSEAWQLISDSLPDAIEGYDPNDPDNPYPYGVPVDNFYPSWYFEEDPYAVSPMANMDLIPDEMYDNAILRALEYTGYNVQWLKDRGYHSIIFRNDFLKKHYTFSTYF